MPPLKTLPKLSPAILAAKSAISQARGRLEGLGLGLSDLPEGG
jgi:hypothetical protein